MIYPKQIAFAEVVLPDGEILHREVVVFDENLKAVSHFPLTHEIAFTEWQNKRYNWQTGCIEKIV